MHDVHLHSSVAGQVGIKQRFGYSTTKAVVLAMTRQLAVEYPKELRVNFICPGTVQTPFVEDYLDRHRAYKKGKDSCGVEGALADRPVGQATRDRIANSLCLPL